MVKNITATAGLGGYDVRINYDPSVIRVVEILGGTAPFNSIAASNINNTTGQASFNAFQVTTPGPTGDITVAYLSISAQGSIGASTTLTVTVNSLVDTNGNSISTTAVNGTVRIVSPQSVLALAPGAGSDGIVRIDIKISRIINPSTGADVPAAEGIGAFDGTATFDNAGVSVLGMRGVDAFAGGLTSNIRNDIGKVFFNAFQVGANPQPPVTLVQLAPRLIGSSATTYNLQVSFSTIADVTGGEVPQNAPGNLSLKRGDARADGNLNIADPLFIAQYLASLRNLGLDATNQVHPVNAASVKLDDTTGDKITITDALLIAQMLANLRDPSFNLIT
jgi:hypothetical protein